MRKSGRLKLSPGGRLKRYFKLDAVISRHYGSFPIIEANAEKFVAAMKGHGTKVIVPEKGKPVRVQDVDSFSGR